MTRELARELVPVIQAYAEGKVVQVKRVKDSQYLDYAGNNMDFWNENWEWRIKPEPRVWWARVYGRSDGVCLGHIFKNYNEAAECSFMQPHEVIKVQEVL